MEKDELIPDLDTSHGEFEIKLERKATEAPKQAKAFSTSPLRRLSMAVNTSQAPTSILGDRKQSFSGASNSRRQSFSNALQNQTRRQSMRRGSIRTTGFDAILDKVGTIYRMDSLVPKSNLSQSIDQDISQSKQPSIQNSQHLIKLENSLVKSQSPSSDSKSSIPSYTRQSVTEFESESKSKGRSNGDGKSNSQRGSFEGKRESFIRSNSQRGSFEIKEETSVRSSKERNSISREGSFSKMNRLPSKISDRPTTNAAFSPFSAIGTIFVDDDGVKISTEKEVKSEKKESSFFHNLIKKESSTTDTSGINAVWAKLGVNLPSKDDQEGDKESIISSESYESTKDLLATQEIIPEISRMLTSRRESIKQSSRTITPTPFIEIDIQIIPSQEPPSISIEKRPTVPSMNQEKKPNAIPTTLLTTPTSLVVPGSDVVHIRRSSFSGMLKPTEPLLKTPDQAKSTTKSEALRYAPSTSLALPIPSTGLAPPESTAKRKKSAVSFAVTEGSSLQIEDKSVIPIIKEQSSMSPTASNEAKEIPILTQSILKPSKFMDDQPSVTKPVESSISSTTSANSGVSASVAKTINAWKKLKNDAKTQSATRAVDSSADASKKFTGFSQIVDVVKDLKTLGLEGSLVNQTDKETLRTVMGVKKWSKLAKEKVQAANIPLRKFAKSTEQRLAVELPQSIYLDLIADMMPILKKCQVEYKKQLGEKHIYSRDIHSYIKSLTSMGRNAGCYLHDEYQEQNYTRRESNVNSESFCWPCIRKKSGKVYTEQEFMRMISKKKILEPLPSNESVAELSMLGAIAISVDDQDDAKSNHIEINIS